MGLQKVCDYINNKLSRRGGSHDMPFDWDFSVFVFGSLPGVPIVKLIGPMEQYAFFDSRDSGIYHVFTKSDCTELSVLADTSQKLTIKYDIHARHFINLPSRDFRDVWLSPLAFKLYT